MKPGRPKRGCGGTRSRFRLGITGKRNGRRGGSWGFSRVCVRASLRPTVQPEYGRISIFRLCRKSERCSRTGFLRAEPVGRRVLVCIRADLRHTLNRLFSWEVVAIHPLRMCGRSTHNLKPLQTLVSWVVDSIQCPVKLVLLITECYENQTQTLFFRKRTYLRLSGEISKKTLPKKN